MALSDGEALVAALELRARRAYELGRARWALKAALPVLAAFAAAMACGRPFGLCSTLGAAALSVAVALSFVGGEAGRAVRPGLVAGSFALVLPLAVRTFGHVCASDVCMSLCLPSCIAGGSLAGGFLALRAAREESGRVFIAGGVVIAGLVGALGCTLAGAGGVLGMIAGALVAGAPVLLAARHETS